MVVGITGTVSSGKTTALLEFKKLGAHTVNTDLIVHRLYKRASLKKKIRQVFGKGIINSRGSINRQQLGNLVFKSVQKRKKLEKLVHPVVANEIDLQLKKKKGPVAIVEVPLLYETGWKNKFDATILVASSPKVSMNRFLRNQKTRAEFEMVTGAQWPLARKMKMADFVIQNNGSRSLLKYGVVQLWGRFQNQITHLS